MSTAGLFHRVVELGRGTYGTVYKGTERRTGREVAFKRMNVTSDEENVPGTAIREICLLKELRHENVVQLFQVLFEPPKITLIFELCDCDLKKYMETRPDGRLDNRTEGKPILKQAFAGLGYLHSRSVVHRDIKPQNIFLNVRPTTYPLSECSPLLLGAGEDRNGNGYASSGAPSGRRGSGASAAAPGTHVIVKLGDFGLARVEDIPVKKYSHEVVTLWYRSPDVLMGSALYTYAVDVWSMGAIFFEMVTGKPLFNGKSDDEQLLVIMRLLGSPTKETWPSMMSYPGTRDKLRKLRPLAERRAMGYALQFEVPSEIRLRERGTAPLVNTYDLPNELWFPYPLFDEYMTTSGFRAVVGEEGIDLLRRCLQYEPRDRISAADALRHPYLRGVPTPATGSLDHLMTSLDQTLRAEGL